MNIVRHLVYGRLVYFNVHLDTNSDVCRVCALGCGGSLYDSPLGFLASYRRVTVST